MSKPALVKDLEHEKFVLNNINWDFFPSGPINLNHVAPFNCRKHHWLPATFVAEIPFTLIEVLSLPNAVVYDPFGGIGTTFFQAFLLNRQPLTTEIGQVSVNFIKSLFILFDPETNFDLMRTRIQSIYANYDGKCNYSQQISSNSQFSNLQVWYSSETFNQIAYLYLENKNCENQSTQALIHISISSLLKAVCSQDRGYGCIADNVFPKKEQIVDKDVLSLFKKHAINLINEIEKQHKKLSSDTLKNYSRIDISKSIVHHDVRNELPFKTESIDMIVTSPPYPNMVDYIKSQRLSYYFFDYDLKADLNLEIGARYKRATRNSLENYLDDMNITNENVSDTLKNGGYICYVMPAFEEDKKNNVDRRKIVESVMENLKNFGLKKEMALERIIPSRRRLHNVKWATLEKENILIYRKRG